MQRTKPQLKVDRIFGSELVPPRKGFPWSATLLLLIFAGSMVALYQYASPIWLCYQLKQQLFEAPTADQAGLAAENLLSLDKEGLAVVVDALADSRIEISGVAYQVLKSRLDGMTTEELIQSDWVSALAGQLRKTAGQWNGESRRFGCQLASAIYTTYKSQGDPQQEDRLRWASARLDTWAVLENYQWEQEMEPLRGATGSATGVEAPASSPAKSPSDSKDLVATVGSSTVGSSSIVSSGGGTVRAIEYEGSATPIVPEVAGDAAAGEESGVRFGDLKQVQTTDEPMARIQVIPKSRRSVGTVISNSPRGVQSQYTSLPSETSESPQLSEPDLTAEAGQAPTAGRAARGGLENGLASGAVRSGTGEESKRWEEKIQRIDARSPELDVALKQKDVLELFELLKSENIGEQAAAVRELDERGLSDVEIALATSLVRGDSASRIKLLLELPRMEIADPSRWYIWMAQNEDREVRRVAIQGLGSVADPEIAMMIRELRVHEADRELKDLLQSILKKIER
jgi:hypothetical protein